MKGLRFYDALPKHKAELVDGRFIIGGNLRKSAMMLAYMVENLGAQYVADLVPRDILQEAVIEVYGRENVAAPLADFTAVKPPYLRVQQLAFNMQFSLFNTPGITVFGGRMSIKLGADIFMPDVYIIRDEECYRIKDAYLEGAPDLIIEVVTPYMRAFDFGIRLDKYAKAGLAEVWMIDYEDRTFSPMVLDGAQFRKVPVSSPYYASVSIPELKIDHRRIFDHDRPGITKLDIFTIEPPIVSELRKREERGPGRYSVPFAPRVDLEPVEITLLEYISWGGEIKFEMVDDGIPVFGGNEETTKEWLGLLIMTMGMKETVKYLPAKEWSAVL